MSKRAYDLKAASEAYSVSIETLKAAIAKGTLVSHRSKPADPKAGTPAGGKYLMATEDLDAWFKSLDLA